MLATLKSSSSFHGYQRYLSSLVTLGDKKFFNREYCVCVGHMGVGEFTIHFCPRDQGLHWLECPSHARRGGGFQMIGV